MEREFQVDMTGREGVAGPPGSKPAPEQLDALRLPGKMFERDALFGIVQVMACPVLSGPMSQVHRKFVEREAFSWTDVWRFGASGVKLLFHADDAFK
ncbi:MAG: hypothetical protein ABSA45_09235 [Verrucomicrobiota bacterium]|jgi:hypothetical protein